MSSGKQLSILKLTIPLFFQILMSMCLGYVDTVMLSHFSDVAVGAVGNSNQIIGLLKLAFAIITSASGVLIAQYLGAKKTEQMNLIYSVAIFFNVTLSLVISAIVVIFAKQLLKLIHIPEVMLPNALSYIRFTGLFLFSGAIIDMVSRIFHCHGKPIICLFIGFGMNITNIIGNYLFLYGPLKFLNLGIYGVALSTCISSFIAMITSLICLRTILNGKISIKYLIPYPKEILSKLIRLGIPTAGENISYNIAQIIITAFVNSLGAVAITSKIYCNIICNFSMIFSGSVAAATAITTGHSVGADKYDEAFHRVLKSLSVSIILSCMISGLNILISPYTLSFFTTDENIIFLGKKVIKIAFFLEIGRCTNLVIIQSLRAAGDVLFPTLLGISSMWGISVVFAWILGIHFNLGLPGIWLAMSFDEILRALIVLFRWLKGSWRNKNLTKTPLR